MTYDYWTFDHTKILDLDGRVRANLRKIQNIKGDVVEASDTAKAALDTAGAVSDTAKAALDTAGAASDTAKAALDTAGAASDTAKAALDTAGAASDTAKAALDTAGAASDTAGAASDTAGAALDQVTELSATFAETIGDSDRIMLGCTIAAAVAVTVMVGFVVFCFYQGVKHAEKGGYSPANSNTPSGKLDTEVSAEETVLQPQQRPIEVF